MDFIFRFISSTRAVSGLLRQTLSGAIKASYNIRPDSSGLVGMVKAADAFTTDGEADGKDDDVVVVAVVIPAWLAPSPLTTPRSPCRDIVAVKDEKRSSSSPKSSSAISATLGLPSIESPALVTFFECADSGCCLVVVAGGAERRRAEGGGRDTGLRLYRTVVLKSGA
jgi:hypothetical protein